MNLNSEITACCSALGFFDGATYRKEPDCLETVKDLIRFLKREDESCNFRRQLGDSQLVQKDLIPLVKEYSNDSDLFDVVLRLLVNLTQPALICFGGKVPEDKTQYNFYLEVISHLQSYKEAFSDEDLYAVLTTKLQNLLDLDWEHRQEEDTLVLERIIILFRNILHVPANADNEQRTDDDASIHDQILWAINSSHLDSLLLFIAHSEQSYCMHILEIISLMFREQVPELLAVAGVNRAQTEKEKDERELLDIRQRELMQKKANMHKFNTRHSRFGGTYSVKDMKSISERDLIYHRSLSDINSLSFDKEKVPKKKPKNRRPLADHNITRRSTLCIRLFLKDFCSQFLESAYNTLMHIVKDKLHHKRAQAHDETYYLWALAFFMEFNRHYNFKVDLVSETLSLQIFHYIHTQLESYYEMMLANKKNVEPWSNRMHLALKAYQEVLKSLAAMDQSSDSTITESSRVIKSNLFYVMEYREIFHTLLRNYSEAKYSKSYVKDLIETVHIFLKLMEHFSKTQGHMMVQKKRKLFKRKKKSSRNTNQSSEMNEYQKEAIWDQNSEELSSVLQGQHEGSLPDITPFDAASDIPLEDQRANAMVKIQDAMRARNTLEAVAFFRAAREVWPDNGEFGSFNMSNDDEFIALREVFFADLPRPVAEVTAAINEEENLEEEEIEGEEEGGDQTAVVQYEQEFKFGDYLKRFCNPDYMQPYAKLLRHYKTNSVFTNHCIIKMFHRVAWDCKLVGMFFQASLFQTFQQVLEDPACQTSPSLKEISAFASYVMDKFFNMALLNSKLYVEMLFWKEVKEVIEMEEGYGSYKAKSSKAKILWTEEQEEELQLLYDEYKNAEGDVMELIQNRLIDQSKTRRQIIRQLTMQNLITSAKDIKPAKFVSKVRVPINWEEQEEVELRELFERFKDFHDPMFQILNSMTIKRSKPNVIRKILELGLVQDKKELRKKRQSKHGKSQRHRRRRNNEEDIEDEENDLVPGSEEDQDDLVEVNDYDDDNEEEEDVEEADVEDQGRQWAVLEPQLIGDLLQSVHDQGFGDAVKWMQDVLRRTADDRDEDGYDQPIPIVPLTEDNETAMSDGLFQRFLISIGLQEPVTAQEIFWRIPTNLSSTMLRSLAESLKLDTSQPNTELRTQHLERFKKLQEMAQRCREETEKKKVKKPSLSKTSAKKGKQGIASSVKATSPAENSKTGKKRQTSTSQKSNRKKQSLKLSSQDDSSDDDRPLSSIPTQKNKNRLQNGEKNSSDEENKSQENGEKKKEKRRKSDENTKEKITKKKSQSKKRPSLEDTEEVTELNIAVKKRKKSTSVSIKSETKSGNKSNKLDKESLEIEITQKTIGVKKKRIVFNFESSEDEKEDSQEDRLQFSNTETSEKSADVIKSKRIQRKVLESDSEDEINETQKNKVLPLNMEAVEDSSETGKSKRNTRKGLESDSEDKINETQKNKVLSLNMEAVEDSSVTGKSKRNTRKVLESDSEDEMSETQNNKVLSLNMEAIEDSSEAGKSKRNTRKVLESDSEDEKNGNQKNLTPLNREVVENLSETGKSKRNQGKILPSDSEDESLVIDCKSPCHDELDSSTVPADDL